MDKEYAYLSRIKKENSYENFITFFPMIVEKPKLWLEKKKPITLAGRLVARFQKHIKFKAKSKLRERASKSVKRF